ncbi:MAG TPA: hypothetical protein VGU68_00255, partial [Ktedonobacteraceae bacterium]|nr:hypothetical protein [Ktedonobacteraceae bacterium]
LAAYWTDYCIQVEANHPANSLSLRLAPDEAQRLPQLLRDSGYILVENEDTPDGSERTTPLTA